MVYLTDTLLCNMQVHSELRNDCYSTFLLNNHFKKYISKKKKKAQDETETASVLCIKKSRTTGISALATTVLSLMVS